MKAFLASLFLPVVLVATASADWILENKIESPQINTTTVTKIKGSKLRIDIDGGPAGAVSSIVDNATGDTIQLLHAQKMAMKMGAAQMKQAMEAAQKSTGAPTGAGESFKPTGQKEKVGDVDCEIYSWSSGGTTARVWVAKNFPKGEDLQKLEKDMRAGPLGKMQTGPDTTNLPGPAIKTEVVAGGTTTKTTVLSLKEQAVDTKEFEIPAGYQNFALPAGLGGK